MQAFQAGKMGTMEGVALVFFLLMPRVFLTIVAQFVQEAGQISWLILIINGIYPMLVAFLLSAVMQHSQQNFYETCQNLLGKSAAFIVGVYYIIVFVVGGVSLLRQYGENTITTALPDADIEIIVLVYVMTSAGLCWLGVEGMARAGTVIMPFVVIGLLLIVFALYPYYVFHHLSPWRGQGLSVALRTGISDAGFNLGIISAFIFWPVFQNGKTLRKVVLIALGISVFLKVIYYIIYIVVFGPVVGAEKTMPFYEMARLVYLNPYLQRIESLFIVEWCWIGVLSVSLNLYSALYLYCQLFHLPNIRPLIIPATLLMGSMSLLAGNLGDVLETDRNLVHIANIGIYVIPTMLYLLYRLKRRRQSKSCTVNK